MARIQKNNSGLLNSIIEALERLEIEYRKAVLKAMNEGNLPYRRCKNNTTSTAIDKKGIGKKDNIYTTDDV